MKMILLSMYIFMLGLLWDLFAAALDSAIIRRLDKRRSLSDYRILTLSRVCEGLAKCFLKNEHQFMRMSVI